MDSSSTQVTIVAVASLLAVGIVAAIAYSAYTQTKLLQASYKVIVPLSTGDKENTILPTDLNASEAPTCVAAWKKPTKISTGAAQRGVPAGRIVNRDLHAAFGSVKTCKFDASPLYAQWVMTVTPPASNGGKPLPFKVPIILRNLGQSLAEDCTFVLDVNDDGVPTEAFNFSSEYEGCVRGRLDDNDGVRGVGAIYSTSGVLISLDSNFQCKTCAKA
jgi:hypothetical protein